MQAERTSRSASTLRECEQKKNWSRPRSSANSRGMWLSPILRRSTCKNGLKTRLWDPSSLLSWLTKSSLQAMSLFWRRSLVSVTSQLSVKCKWMISCSSFPLFSSRQSSTMQTSTWKDALLWRSGASHQNWSVKAPPIHSATTWSCKARLRHGAKAKNWATMRSRMSEKCFEFCRNSLWQINNSLLKRMLSERRHLMCSTSLQIALKYSSNVTYSFLSFS